jgi:hypothetical protein
MPMNDASEVDGIESALRSLRPALSGFGRDQILYRAGQVSVTRRAWLWPSVAALLAVVAGSLGVALLRQPAPQVVTQVVLVPVAEPIAHADAKPPATPVAVPAAAQGTDSAPAWMALVQQRDQLLRWGPARLSSTAGGSATTALPPLERELGLPSGSLTGPQFRPLRIGTRTGDSL